MKFKDLSGERFGRLVAKRMAPREKGKRPRYECICDCGKERTVLGLSLSSGNTVSCGCAKLDELKSRGDGSSSEPEYKIWWAMQRRCHDPRVDNYARYGGRGIRVADEWRGDRHAFRRFLEHVGPRPSPNHSIDRINNAGNYEPGNVRWATDAEQRRNRSDNHVVVIGGTPMILSDAARLHGLSLSVVAARVSRGVTGDALFAPVRRRA